MPVRDDQSATVRSVAACSTFAIYAAGRRLQSAAASEPLTVEPTTSRKPQAAAVACRRSSARRGAEPRATRDIARCARQLNDAADRRRRSAARRRV